MKTLISSAHVSYTPQPMKAFSPSKVEATPLPPTPTDAVHLNKVASPHPNLRSGTKYFFLTSHTNSKFK